MPKRKALSESSPLKQTLQNGNAQTPKTKSPQSQKQTNGKQTPQGQKAILKSPNMTSKIQQSTPRGKKGTPTPKKIVLEDENNPISSHDEEEVDDEIVFNFKRHDSSKEISGTSEEDENEEDEPATKKAKKSIPSEKDASERLPKQGDSDAKSLFVKNLPTTYTVSQLKAWSKDILDVRFRVFKRLGKQTDKQQQMRCAFLEFESEAKAELNYNRLKGKKVEKTQLHVDYVGAKSLCKSYEESQKDVQYDKKKLFVAGLSQEVTKSDLEELFPKASDVVVPKTKKLQQLLGYAFISFENEVDCKKAHDEMQNKMLKGNHLVVLYSNSRKKDNEEKKKPVTAVDDDEENDTDEDDGDTDEEDTNDENNQEMDSENDEDDSEEDEEDDE